LSAELLAKPFDQVHKQLQRSLQQTAHRMVQSVFDAMDRLVDRSVLGLIEWTSEEVCKFHFFREKSHYQRTKRTSHNQNRREYDAEEDTWEVEEVSVTETREQEQTSRFRHEHQVMDARRLAHDSTRVAVPIAIQPIVHKLPNWLTPETSIVTGDLFCEEVIEQPRRKRQWLKEILKKHKVRVEYDPAIVIDRFVLTGWGEQEMLAEVSRRRKQAAHATSEVEIAQFGAGHRRATLLARCFGAASLITWGLGILASPALVVLSVLCLCVSLWQTTRALDNAAHMHREKPAIGYIAAGVLCRLGLWGGWMLVIAALILGPRWIAIIGIAMTYLEGPLLRIAAWWAPRSLSVRQK